MTKHEDVYKVLRVTDSTYLDNSNEAIDGKAVRVQLFAFDEIITIRVPNLRNDIVEGEVLQYIAVRMYI